MRHLIAPSSMLEVEPTSIHSSSQKGMHTQHPRLSRSRRDTPSYGAMQPMTDGAPNGQRCPIPAIAAWPVERRGGVESWRCRLPRAGLRIAGKRTFNG